MKLSIIIPIFNEQKTVEELITKVLEVSLPRGVKKEIVVVNDGSTDSTLKILQKIKGNIKIINHEKNQGKGAAIRTGIKHSSGDLFIIQDADLEYNPSDYKKLLIPILTNNAQVVYGTRLVNYPLKIWGKDKTVMPVHLIANKFLTGFTNLVYRSHLTDMETCYKLLTRNLLEKLSLKSEKFDFEPEVTAKILRLNIPIVEVPITVKPRTYKEGKKIGYKDGIAAIWTLIKYRFIN
ncbi:glycosyltransferase family 2 protein [Candidatus Daviesbacteria bacterium]|nr:glycosyltransferase family 2 protein [Candidatus Daviesbacteria bacterium]